MKLRVGNGMRMLKQNLLLICVILVCGNCTITIGHL